MPGDRGSFFNTLGIPLLLGRGIAPGETNTAVLSYRTWHGIFAENPAIVGQKLILEGRVYVVAGVLPANHRSVAGFGISPEIYLPVTHDDDNVQLYARLPKGTNIAIARERLRGVFAQLDHINPRDDWKRADNPRVTGVTGFEILNQMLPGAIMAFFVMLLVVVGLVLLITCTNVASLLLARASSRSHELAIRLSLGASRRRIVRHLLAESLLISVLGAIAGLAINLACADLITNLTLPVPAPIQLVVLPDWRLLWYSFGIVLVSALLCGLLPALRAVRRDVNHALEAGRAPDRAQVGFAGQSGCRAACGFDRFAGYRILVRSQPAASHSHEPRFRCPPHDLGLHAFGAGQIQRSRPGQQMSVVNTALEQIRALPGVEAAAITRRVPLNDNCDTYTGLRTDISSTVVRVQYECNNVGPE